MIFSARTLISMMAGMLSRSVSDGFRRRSSDGRSGRLASEGGSSLSRGRSYRDALAMDAIVRPLRAIGPNGERESEKREGKRREGGGEEDPLRLNLSPGTSCC